MSTGIDAASAVPVYQDYMNAILDALRAAPTALPIEELDRLVLERMKLAPEVVRVPHDPERPDRSEVSYRIAWARTYLKKSGLLENPSRGRWTVTGKGREAGEIDAYAIAAAVAQAGRLAAPPGSADQIDGDEPDDELLTARVGAELETQLRALHQQLAIAGQLLSADQASRALARFREQFGPNVLAGLDGEALLARMHGRGTRDSLVYWLEFKDDEEFSAQFGSIGGGSALKFGIYQAAESKLWMKGAGQTQVQLSVEDAAALVRRQRDQLVAGVRALEAAAAGPGDVDYSALQTELVSAAPDLAETSWGHKYFALLFPKLLEPFHGADYQAHQLFKLLKLPGRGRYDNARIFVGVAKQLSISLLDLTTVVHRRNGGPHRYWRVGTTVDGASEWDRMRRGGFASVGWGGLGNLADLVHDAANKKMLRNRFAAQYPGDPAAMTRSANQVFQFVTAAAERDIVVAMEGTRVRGVGRIVGGYSFEPDDGPFPLRRAVEWLREGEWKLPETEGIQTTLVPIRKPTNIIEIETRLLGKPQAPPPIEKVDPILSPSGVTPPSPPAVLAPLTDVIARINAVLQRKRQVILCGPPGTGKTHWAERAVDELAARGWFGIDAASLDAVRRKTLLDDGAIQLCSFHPAYGYEDFLEGYRPIATNGALAFELRDGVFKRLCARAHASPKKPFFLIIDEINRGDVPRIFGELLTVLEREKRGKSIVLPVSGKPFSVPDNVFVVGTMNPTDRSIALLDAALRRRFGFIELEPDSKTLAGASAGGLPLGPWLDELNRRVVQHVGRDARHLQIGHSYLLAGGGPVRDLARFAEVLRDDIVPLLKEYCYEDFGALERILGPKLVSRAKQCIEVSLFEPERHGDLVQALLGSFDQITTTPQAVMAAAADPSIDADEEPEQAPST